jgi:hypothetical protein
MASGPLRPFGPESDTAAPLLKRKGPLLMKKRPKSREETPKEGSGNAKRYRTQQKAPHDGGA